MIDKPLEQITFSDIERLFTDQVSEGKTLDYKRETYGFKDEDKREILKDVSSFANTLGGDIVIGVDEAKGVPTSIQGVHLEDVDKEKLRLEQIIRCGLQPRIEFSIHSFQNPAGANFLIIRMPESLESPHRVFFQSKGGEFYARNSAGKYPMDTDELRRAFTLTSTIYDQITSFKRERVSLISRGESPLPMRAGGKLIVHLVPVSAFRTRQRIDISAMQKSKLCFPPMFSTHGYNDRINLDGLLSYLPSWDGPVHAYTQLFRSGIVESLLTNVVQSRKEQSNILDAKTIERESLKAVPQYLAGMKAVGVEAPVWGFVTIIETKGAYISTSRPFQGDTYAIDRDTVALPEFLIDNLAIDAAATLRPIFDLMWNASGYPQSLNFDASGKWIG